MFPMQAKAVLLLAIAASAVAGLKVHEADPMSIAVDSRFLHSCIEGTTAAFKTSKAWTRKSAQVQQNGTTCKEYWGLDAAIPNVAIPSPNCTSEENCHLPTPFCWDLGPLGNPGLRECYKDHKAPIFAKLWQHIGLSTMPHKSVPSTMAHNVPDVRVHDADPCACLMWKDAYTAPYNGQCGVTGREASFVPPDVASIVAAVSAGVDTEFCTNFFTKINDNFCVNWNFDSADTDGKQWCYVSPECKNLGNGSVVRWPANSSATLAYKTCTDDDEKLILKDPIELSAVAAKLDLNLGLLAKWSYPVPGKSASMTFANSESARESQHATLWDSEDGNPPYKVYYGEKVYQIDFLPAPGGFQASFEGRMGDVNGLYCIEHCDQADSEAETVF